MIPIETHFQSPHGKSVSDEIETNEFNEAIYKAREIITERGDRDTEAENLRTRSIDFFIEREGSNAEFERMHNIIKNVFMLTLGVAFAQINIGAINSEQSRVVIAIYMIGMSLIAWRMINGEKWSLAQLNCSPKDAIDGLQRRMQQVKLDSDVFRGSAKKIAICFERFFLLMSSYSFCNAADCLFRKELSSVLDILDKIGHNYPLCLRFTVSVSSQNVLENPLKHLGVGMPMDF